MTRCEIVYRPSAGSVIVVDPLVVTRPGGPGARAD
jgi:hypothetical protein